MSGEGLRGARPANRCSNLQENILLDRSMPQLSVIIGAKDSEDTMEWCLRSILTSTYTDLEVVVVDDGSTDRTLEILNRLAETESRLRIISRPRSRGLASALNCALSETDSRYVARLDADDITGRRRFSLQTAILNRKPEIGVLGSGRYKIDLRGRTFGYVSPNTHSALINWHVNWGVPFAHPTVMFRRSSLDQSNLRYNESFLVSQDFDLWTRLLRTCVGANDSRPLIWYRVHQGQISNKQRELRERTFRSICGAQLERILGNAPDPALVKSQAAVFSGSDSNEIDQAVIREAVSFRQYVCEVSKGDVGNPQAAAAGYGLDLIRLMNRSTGRAQAGWIMSDRFRKGCVLRGMRYAAFEVAIRRFWRSVGLRQPPRFV